MAIVSLARDSKVGGSGMIWSCRCGHGDKVTQTAEMGYISFTSGSSRSAQQRAEIAGRGNKEVGVGETETGSRSTRRLALGCDFVAVRAETLPEDYASAVLRLRVNV